MEAKEILDILPHFALEGRLTEAKELKSGNINATYRLALDDHGIRREYILQRINTYVFRDPERMMKNIAAVTDHLRAALLKAGEPPDRRVLRVIPTAEGKLLHTDSSGCWRVYPFISGAFARDTVDAAAFREVGRGFGRFQQLLADYPAERLYESIPDFHNTEKRYEQLSAAIKADAAGRVKEVQPEIQFLFAHRERLCGIVRLIARGEMPLRVTHNDTKSNNVMLDKATGRALCVIDLDTVMPGSVLYDYGDAIRFGASTAPEDEPDTGKIALDMEKTAAFTQGFIEETGGFLRQDELQRLPLGIEAMTGEVAVRFLADYLNGDRYFKINFPCHNLVRARAQIALLRDVESKREALQKMVDELIGL
ncbi:MAG: aminoglycoside phosphotransferase family protein [Clostridia bacterium]|nr:aminoglycoside phosphotransferase family protein [Clostridia bacterium]